MHFSICVYECYIYYMGARALSVLLENYLEPSPSYVIQKCRQHLDPSRSNVPTAVVSEFHTQVIAYYDILFYQ